MLASDPLGLPPTSSCFIVSLSAAERGRRPVSSESEGGGSAAVRRFEVPVSVRRRDGVPKLVAVVASLAAALVAGSGASAAPNRFDMGVYDPVANQNGGGQHYSTLDEPLAMQKTKQTRSRFVRIPIHVGLGRLLGCSTALPQSDRPGHRESERARVRLGSRRRRTVRRLVRLRRGSPAGAHRGLEPILSVFGAPAFAECDGASGAWHGGQPQVPGGLEGRGRRGLAPERSGLRSLPHRGVPQV